MRRAVLSAAVAAMVAASVVVLPGPVSAVSSAGSADLGGVATARYGGADRYETSLLIAEAVAAEAGGSLSSVVLVSGERWTDAVVAAPVAGSLGAAVLMTPPGELRADALEFLERTGVSEAVVMGPEAGGGAHGSGRGVAAAVLRALAEAGIAAERVVGADRFATSVAAAEEVTPGVMGTLGRTAIVASGDVFADALVAGPFAARGIHPVLLSAPDELPAEVASYLSTSGIDHVVVMGGESALSADVETAIKALGVSVTRIAGTTRYDTAVKAAELASGRYSSAAGRDCFATGTVGLARARVPFDSFSAAPLLGRLCAPLLLADPHQIPADTAAFLDTARAGHTTVDLRVFGGNAAISQTAIDTYLADDDTGDNGDDAVPVGLPSGTCGGSINDEPSQLLDSDQAEDPAWSPDCSKIVYSFRGSLWSMDNDATNRQRLTAFDGSHSDEPAWSPDGSQIAYTRTHRDDNGNWLSHIYLIGADGNGKTKLTKGDVRDRKPSWSPDESRIAFERQSGDARRDDGLFARPTQRIAVMNADGSGLTTLTTGDAWHGSPAWSPDGDHVAYVSEGAIWLIDPDGTGARRVLAGAFWGGGMSWSPDGRRIAFARGDWNAASIVIADLHSPREATVAALGGVNVLPRWSPDGDRIAFTNFPKAGDYTTRSAFAAGAGGTLTRVDADCKPRSSGERVTVGFPFPDWVLPSTGTLRVAVLFMDFADAPANHSTNDEAALGLPYAEAYMESASYGKLDVEFVPVHRWLRAEQPLSRYATLTTATNQTSISHVANLESVALADEHLDFSDIDVALTVFPSTHFTSGISLRELATADGETFALASVGNEMRPAQREPFEWGHTAAHELVHKFGLADYFPYDFSLHETTGQIPAGKTRVDTWWGFMVLRSWYFADDTDPGLRPTWRHSGGHTTTTFYPHLEPREMLAWSRWQLGWLDESQVRCVDGAGVTASLAPIAQPADGVAMAAVPLNRHEVIVIESRRKLGYDLGRDHTAANGSSTTLPALITEGVLVYTVDALIPTGHRPLKFAGSTGNGQVDDFPVLQVGESVNVGGYTITVTADNGDTHTVSITKSN